MLQSLASLLAGAAKTVRLLGLFSCKVGDIRQSAVALARLGHIWLLFLWPLSLVKLTLSSTTFLHLILNILSLLYPTQTFFTLYSTDIHQFILHIYSPLCPPETYSTLSSRDIHHFILHTHSPPYPPEIFTSLYFTDIPKPSLSPTFFTLSYRDIVPLVHPHTFSTRHKLLSLPSTDIL